MTAYWPTDEGWPYADVDGEQVDVDASPDDDLLNLKMELESHHLLDELDALEREVIARRFGLEGRSSMSMKMIQADLGVPRADLRGALGSGLAKLRAHLIA